MYSMMYCNSFGRGKNTLCWMHVHVIEQLAGVNITAWLVSVVLTLLSQQTHMSSPEQHRNPLQYYFTTQSRLRESHGLPW